MRDTGFEKPSAIQQKGIVPFTKGLDVIQQAQSGTGKTATFCAGILNNLDYNLLECQVGPCGHPLHSQDFVLAAAGWLLAAAEQQLLFVVPA